MQDYHDLIKGEVIFSVDELTVDSFILFVDEVDTEIICISAAFERAIKRAIILTNYIILKCTIGWIVCFLLTFFHSY